ncbi:MAG: glutamyl-tRNA reductase [Bacillota bacterium]
MAIVGMGLNYKETSVEIREQITFNTHKLEQALDLINDDQRVTEGLILSTCNRTEVYVICSEEEAGAEFILELLSRFSTLFREELTEYLYCFRQLSAVEHLYRVAAGLDSMILGEEQILGQLKEAFDLAQQENSIDTTLHHLFTEALKVGKRARTETSINNNAVSLSYAAVELAKKIFGALDQESVLVLGAGEMSQLTLQTLMDHGVKTVYLANRTYSKAVRLADEFDGEAVKWSQIKEILAQVDIVISSTRAPHYVIKVDKVKEVLPQRDYAPLFFIDIAVPRDIDPAVYQLDQIYAYNIDDLESVVEANLEERQKAVEDVEEIIAQELASFSQWHNSQQVVPIIKALRQQAEDIRAAEVERALAKLDGINQQQRDTIVNLTHRIVNKLLHHPTVQVKEFTNYDQSDLYLTAAKELFGLELTEEDD